MKKALVILVLFIGLIFSAQMRVLRAVDPSPGLREGLSVCMPVMTVSDIQVTAISAEIPRIASRPGDVEKSLLICNLQPENSCMEVSAVCNGSTPGLSAFNRSAMRLWNSYNAQHSLQTPIVRAEGSGYSRLDIGETVPGAGQRPDILNI